MEAIEVRIPHGVSAAGGADRRAWLRPMRGEDEEFLVEEGGAMLPAHRTTALLARCLARLGDEHPVDEDAVRKLRAGDRETLLLHLRRLSLGPRLSLVLRCPDEACAELLEVDVDVAELLVDSGRLAAERGIDGTAAGDGRTIGFRLPSGADIEAVASLALRDELGAVRALAARCAVALDGEALGELAASEVDSISEAMSALDPQACVVLNARCAACETVFEVPFDCGEHLYREVWRRRDDLYRELHVLALNYHWREADILAMPRARRRRYVDLLSGTVEHAEAGA